MPTERSCLGLVPSQCEIKACLVEHKADVFAGNNDLFWCMDGNRWMHRLALRFAIQVKRLFVMSATICHWQCLKYVIDKIYIKSIFQWCHLFR